MIYLASRGWSLVRVAGGWDRQMPSQLGLPQGRPRLAWPGPVSS
jgi:hypothetical protein